MASRYKNITGADVVARALRGLASNAAKEVAFAINKGGEEIRDRAKALAPERTGELIRNIEMRDLSYREIKGAFFGGKVLTSRKFGVNIGVFPKHNGGKAFYAPFVEFGTSKRTKGQLTGNRRQSRGRRFGNTHTGATAKPFLFPAYWSLRKRVMSRINRAIRKAARETFRRGRR